MVNIIFKSIDAKDVTVVIRSGGENIAEVDVDAGKTATWNFTVSELQDKVLYMDRWRPGFLGISGSGGGSLKLWIPRSSKGGHLKLHVLINLSQAFGGSRGVAFSDITSVGFGQTVTTIIIRDGDHVDAVTLQVSFPAELTLSHGGSGGTDNTLTLAEGEYITSMEIHWARKALSTRIFYLNFTTNTGNSVSGGVTTENNSTVSAPKGFQLSGFFGHAEGAIYQLGAIWTKIDAEKTALTDIMGSDWHRRGDREAGHHERRPNSIALLTNTSAVNSTADTNVEELQDLIDSNTTRGYQLKNLTDHVIASVNDIRNATPNVAAGDIRQTSDAAFKTRDLLRKTFGVIIDQLIETATTDLGASAKANDNMLEVANMGLMLGGLDTTGIAYMASQLVQPTCGPTSFIGEIDDGSLHDALGLSTVDEAFEGSFGTWTKEGDGIVELVFDSTDTKDVTVVIHSGGDAVAEVDVDAGDTVTWRSTMLALQGTALYLDRWRSNVAGIPGSGGGSLVLWIPRASQGGHLHLQVRINAG
ncbi:unnamed protein product [Phytophthora lilii]|uniref:Unnamed protein product n=1 Tax=Phytophthora lilii TaxID=2077276 RepID=A0A9W6UCU2_9STRA|nr:unnamed protein product [Phytophthora lilii]